MLQHIRSVPVEIRAEKSDEGKMTAAGRAIPYGVEIVLWKHGDYEEREIIEVNAFGESLEKDDQRALWNHRRDIVLGRRSKKTLRLTQSDSGIDFEIDFPNSPEGQSKFVTVDRGDVAEMSFGFNDINLKEEFLKEGELRIYKRTVQKAQLMEVSPVTWAAYEADTSIQARSNDEIEKRIQLIDSKLSEASEEFDRAAVRQREAELRDIQIQYIGDM